MVVLCDLPMSRVLLCESPAFSMGTVYIVQEQRCVGATQWNAIVLSSIEDYLHANQPQISFVSATDHFYSAQKENEQKTIAFKRATKSRNG